MKRWMIAGAIAITGLAFFLRVQKINQPFWIDEVLFVNMMDNFGFQEFTTIIISKLIGSRTEWVVRLPIVLAGSLTAPAVLLIFREKKLALALMVFIAVCPLFVFWSGLARPYAFAGLFMVLGFRWPGFYAVALLTTPLSILGLNLFEIKKKWWIYLLLIAGAILLYMIRVDSERNFLSIGFLKNAKRIWYLPILSLAVHAGIFVERLPGIRKSDL